MKKIMIFLIFAFSLFPQVLLASEPFEFTSAVIRSFKLCQIASERSETMKSGDPTFIMKDIIVFNDEMLFVKGIIDPYQKSRNEKIKISSTTFSNIYSSIVKNKEKFLNIWESALNNPDQIALQQGTFLRQLSEVVAENEKHFRMIPVATALVAHVLVDYNRLVEGKIAFLTITKTEREALIKQLVENFGDNIKGEHKAGLLPIEASALMLYEFLNEEWKPSDAK